MYGVDWQNALLNEYGMNHWCLTVDADEWFIYPGYEPICLAPPEVTISQASARYVDHRVGIPY